MTRPLHISDEMYLAIETLAREQETTPEAIAEILLKQRLAEHAVLQQQNAEWSAGLDAALARAEHGENTRYSSNEEFIAALDEIPTESGGE